MKSFPSSNVSSSHLRERTPEEAGVIPEVPDHELVRRIGRGSYGEVWLARNVLGGWRAVKIIKRGEDENADGRGRGFEREFSGIKRFEPVSRSCPGLVHVLQVGKGEGFFYCVMELADDGCADEPWHPEQSRAAAGMLNPESYIPRTLSLEKRRRGKLPAQECLRLGLRLAEALEHLHGQNLLHRDLKPSNIIFVNGEPKLADIGLVAEVSEARSYVGTEGYIPPEGPNSAQGDIYSLGKVLYEISTGKDRQDFPEPVTMAGDEGERRLLQELNAVVVKACDPDLGRRYGSAGAMLRELRLVQQGSSVRKYRARRKRVKVLAVAAMLLGGVAIAGMATERFLETRIAALQGASSRVPPRFVGKIPERPVEARLQLIDLSPHYTASLVEAWHPGPVENTLKALPMGVRKLAGTEFDVRGLVQLSGGELRANAGDIYPQLVGGIEVAQWVKELHFLHGTISEMVEGSVVGRYVVHYGSGRRAEIPIRYGINVRPLWQPVTAAGGVPEGVLAWSGENSATRERGLELRLYKMSWENPHPEDEVVTISFESAMKNCAPFLVGLTVEESDAAALSAVERPDVIGLLQRHASEFPEFPRGDGMQPVVLAGTPVEVEGIYYHALRLRTPPGKNQDMIWALSAPTDFRVKQWYIAPVSGRMKAGFEDWYHAESSLEEGREFTFQFLDGRKLRANAEYLLWFGLASESSPELKMMLKFVPAGSANPHYAAELLQTLGFDAEVQGKKCHKHYCLQAMK